METLIFICIVIWIVFIVAGPKVDRRYRTGYKYNEIPISWRFKLKVSFYFWIIIGVLCFFVPSKEKVKRIIAVYRHPNNKSEIVSKIENDIPMDRIRETKYFYQIKYKDPGGEFITGYVVKDSI